jgi:tetratricopeptide (TPR) repeat protein
MSREPPLHLHSEAARALASGDALRALGLIGRVDDAEALLLRGIAYAQIGDLDRARRTLDRASSAEPLTSARIAAARAEIDLASGKAASALEAAREAAASLERLGDAHNAAMQRLVASRALVLLGDLDGAWRAVDDVPASLVAVAALVRAEIAMRRVQATAAAAALSEASRSSHELLVRAAATMTADLARPVARLLERGNAPREVTLAGVEAAFSGESFLVDACRRLVRAGLATIPLARRPVLFELVRTLASRWPEDVARDELVRHVFGARRPNDSHRVRLRVEVARLRKLLTGIASLTATRDGYALSSSRTVLVLMPLTDDESARVGTLLGDGATWSAQELAEHAGISKRTALRALSSLVADGRVLCTGRGRERRYASATGRIASRMLLLGLVPKS